MTADITLRATHSDDLPLLYEQQLDPEARRMAAFVQESSLDREGYITRALANISNPENVTCTIIADGQVAGSVVSYLDEGQREVGYWVDKAFWGQGVATAALRQFLTIVTSRPLYARAASDNSGSLRVLEKCGFTRYGSERSYSNARGEWIEETLLRLD